mgnify:CR=1 FL=1
MSARNYIKQLAELPTPFYFYDMELLNRTLNKATEASSRYGYKIHYALKSNFDPRIVEAVRRAGMGMDCVSGNEVRMAVENGFAASDLQRHPPTGYIRLPYSIHVPPHHRNRCAPEYQ